MSYYRKALQALMIALPLAAALPGSIQGKENNEPSPKASVEQQPGDILHEKWGIQVSSVFLSAGGNMVDFRYRVLDPAKAATLTKAELKPLLIDQTSGAKLSIPSTPKVGPLRQTVKQPVAGKIYFMLFANTQHHVKSGDKVTIVAGDFRVQDLTVE